MRFEDKVAVVTGGAQGIGMAVSQALAREGARVYVADVDEEAGREYEADMAAEGYPVRFVATDVGVEADIVRLMETASEAGSLDILVSNAGMGVGGTLVDRPTELWDRVLAVNLRAAYLCARHGVPLMPPGASIVTISSTRALMSEPNTEPYSASKGGLLALTHSLAVSLAERRIRVNCISPGWIDTSNWKKRRVRQREELSRADHEQHPAGRVGTPEDIAQACVFLADGSVSGFITGQNFVIDGGMTVRMIYV